MCVCFVIHTHSNTFTIQFLYVAMLKEKKNEKAGSKQFRWLPPVHTTMLILLAEEAMKGNKPSNIFKAGSFATAAKAIST